MLVAIMDREEKNHRSKVLGKDQQSSVLGYMVGKKEA